jgi:hypothetical protein
MYLMTYFGGKKFYNSLLIGLNFFLHHFKNKIFFQFCDICGYTRKKVEQQIFSPLSFVAVFGSRIRDPGSEMDKKQDPG